MALLEEKIHITPSFVPRSGIPRSMAPDVPQDSAADMNKKTSSDSRNINSGEYCDKGKLGQYYCWQG